MIHINSFQRDYFDLLLEEVLQTLPESVHKILETVPLHVEDYPSIRVQREMGLHDRTELYGMYQGVPVTSRSVQQPVELPEIITLYREAIILSALPSGIRHARRLLHWHKVVDTQELQRQIRITILHELGHYFGLEEEDLEKAGY